MGGRGAAGRAEHPVITLKVREPFYVASFGLPGAVIKTWTRQGTVGTAALGVAPGCAGTGVWASGEESIGESALPPTAKAERDCIPRRVNVFGTRSATFDTDEPPESLNRCDSSEVSSRARSIFGSLRDMNHVLN